jgi:hypothetical protein
MSKQPTRLISIEQAISTWAWRDAPADLTRDDLMKPDTWAHVTRMLVPGSHVVVQPQGLPWEAEVIVLGAGVGFAKVKLIRFTELNEGEQEAENSEPLPDGLEVIWKGPSMKYAVVRSSDKEVLSKEHTVRADAEQWARNHAKAMAA